MSENANITINGNVTVNAQGKAQKEERQPIDRTGEVLISNETSFTELIRILQKRPEAIVAAKTEMEEKKREAEEERRRKEYGEDYDLLCDDDEGQKKELEKHSKRPRPYDLRNFEPMVARIEFSNGGFCEVFTNGYAVYDNGNRKCVVWVPDCSSAIYYFGPLKDKEKEYMDQKKEIGEDDLGPLPWYHALIIGGEDRIEYNMAHPKSKGSSSDTDDPTEWETKGNYRWACGAQFDSPEEAYLKMEAAEERRMQIRAEVKKLKKTHREAIEMCYFDGLTQEDAAKKLGRSQSSISERIKSGKKILKKNLKDIF